MSGIVYWYYMGVCIVRGGCIGSYSCRGRGCGCSSRLLLIYKEGLEVGKIKLNPKLNGKLKEIIVRKKKQWSKCCRWW